MNARRSWVFRLPEGLREQPGWILIGGLCFLAGLSYLLGIAESTAITRVLSPAWLRVWGGFLGLAGVLVITSTLACNKPLERLSLRLLSLGLMVYAGWILTAVPLSRATMTVVLCISFVGLAEIRVAVLKALFKPLPAGLLEGDK